VSPATFATAATLVTLGVVGMIVCGAASLGMTISRIEGKAPHTWHRPIFAVLLGIAFLVLALTVHRYTWGAP
jgi:hypothetical protein